MIIFEFQSFVKYFVLLVRLLHLQILLFLFDVEIILTQTGDF